MIFFDVTKSAAAGHRSGLIRVTSRLQKELAEAAKPAIWSDGFRELDGKTKVPLGSSDWLLTAELFCEGERPGFWALLKNPPCRTAAIFHDAIPLKLPHVTWPQSVARQPEYMKMLAAFERVFAVSEASRRDLVEFWRWQGAEPRGTAENVELGSDFDGAPRGSAPISDFKSQISNLLCVGIIEPRKNQAFLLDVCAELWREGMSFELHIVGRVNPHFGRPIAKKIKTLQKNFRGLHFNEAADDKTLAGLYTQARASVFPTLAEGCGLPLLESLWRGVPCVCSDLPVLRENADGGGCLVAAPNDLAAWRSALRAVLTDDALIGKLRAETATRLLPRWADTAAGLRAALV